MAVQAEKKEVQKIEKERANLKLLVAQNPNYFGNLADSAFKPVKKIVGNTQYEQLTCIGLDPERNLLEATIAVKLPYGYSGGLCQAGSQEFVRFYLDYGSGWQDAGMVATNVHDIPNLVDCSKQGTKPLTYAVTLPVDPSPDICDHAVLPKVRAILSWEMEPPPGNANWPPVWGNVMDRHIQIKPRKKNLIDFVDVIAAATKQKIKLPPEFEPVAQLPIPLPDPPPLSLADLAMLYQVKFGAKGATKGQVESHRFGVTQLSAQLASGSFSQATVSASIMEWKAAGLDWNAAVVALEKTQADVNYEELECLALDSNLERLVATFRIKRPVGYSGDLCHPGSLEHVAFWADWDNTCQWTYLDTVTVRVHDIASIPADGLSYSAILPVDLTHHRTGCEKPKIGRIRAVLSWATPPSTVDPEALTYWGNRLDAHVQIKPGVVIPPGELEPVITILGGIPIGLINAVSGMTMPAAFFASNGLPPDASGRPCPFAARVVLKGPSFPGYKYRVEVRNLTTSGPWTPVTTTMKLVDWSGTVFTDQIADSQHFFTFVPFALNFENVLAWWDTSGDDLWEIRLQLADMADNLLPGVDSHRIQLDNTWPEVSILLKDVGNCGKYSVGTPVEGTFVARDAHLGHYSLGTSPYAGPVVPASGTVQTLPYPGDAWTLDTDGMTPCGYIVSVYAVDRAIINSAWVGHERWASAGFCLEKA